MIDWVAGRVHADKYARAQPFPHIVIDDFLLPGVADKVEEEFPDPTDSWTYSNTSKERKTGTGDRKQIPPTALALIDELNGEPFLRELEELTGIRPLMADPTLRGGGLHVLEYGGYLGVHVDFNVYQGLVRRVNLLLYFNHDWKYEDGGHLELWNNNALAASISPDFNRAVIFSASKDSWHGNPEPVTRTRRSLALYYYSPGNETYHSTIFRED